MDELKKIIDFFKDKNDDDDENKRKKSLTKLAIYFLFLVIVIFMVRFGSDSSNNTNNKNEANNQPKVENKTEVKDDEPQQEQRSLISDSDVNYSYMYTVTLDGETETYIGKRIDDKEKYSYTKNGEVKEYAIKDDNYFILEGDTYHLIDKPDNNFKYCDIEKVLSIIEKMQPSSENPLVFYVDNSKLAYKYGNAINEEHNDLNTIVINTNEDSIESVELNFSSYISSVLTGNHTLTIKMEYANVGKVEDFNIKLN